MKNIYRALVPLGIRKTIKDYQEYQRYQQLRSQEGHIYQCFDTTKSIFVHIPKAGGFLSSKVCMVNRQVVLGIQHTDVF